MIRVSLERALIAADAPQPNGRLTVAAAWPLAFVADVTTVLARSAHFTILNVDAGLANPHAAIIEDVSNDTHVTRQFRR